ncbi:Hypothetical protein SRAE_2000127000 [Strongyloides ratti]|uniref:Uncharacterized protein n=1 Tax=Strongyloides ratti TaxID=34506 RepID=A0A090LA38_STRRB|nr:Hypothetical protein SRAE_2000127000 [Strongyloides ratti]CEF66602.1 Hypothetical protein SRAE_2000127000 [Strongyloides ratti]
MQASQNIIKQNIIFLNNNIPNLNIKYEDLFNKNGKCNFSRIILYIYETITLDKVEDINPRNSQKISYQILMGSQKFYSIKKVQEILKIFLNKDKISLKRIHRPDNMLVCETLNFLRKLYSAGIVLRNEVLKIHEEINERKELFISLNEEKKNLENILASYDNTNKFEETEKLLFQVHEDFTKKEIIKEKLLLEVKQFDEETVCLMNQIDIAKKREIDLEKEYKQLLSLLTNAKSEMIFDDTFVAEGNKRFLETSFVLEDEKKILENEIEKIDYRFNLLNQLNEIIDKKYEALEYLKNNYESLKNIDEKINNECKNIEEKYKTFLTFFNEPLDLLRKHEQVSTNSLDVIKNIFLLKINESIEKTKRYIENFEKIDKYELFKDRYNKEIDKFFE